MEISKKRLSLLVTSTVLLSLLAGLMVNAYVLPHGTLKGKDNVIVFAERQVGNDVVVGYWSVGNLLTNIAENETRTRMAANASYVNVGWISLGNATPAVTLTQLTTQYTRETATINTPFTYGSHSSFNITKKYTFTETVWLNAAGAHWAYTGDNNLYACAYLQTGGASLEWNSGDNVTITWIFTFSYA